MQYSLKMNRECSKESYSIKVFEICFVSIFYGFYAFLNSDGNYTYLDSFLAKNAVTKILVYSTTK